MADLENFVPATSLTLFRLGSISKPITAIAILQLSERGKLDLDV
jgi:CubicO group peptidase (beta-lactamase class C family)